MGANLDPRIREACDLLDTAQRLEHCHPGDFHAGTLEQRHTMAAELRSRAATLRRQVHGR